MELGTIIAIIQLSGAVLKLGRDIANEFFSAGAPERLKHLNSRLQTLNETLERVLAPHGSRHLTTKFAGSKSIEKTLKECKTFLEGYKSLLAETRRRRSVAQHVLLVIGPDAERIDEFHKKIDQHHIELSQWRMESIDGKLDILISHRRLSSTAGDLPLQPRNVLDPISEFPPAAPPYQATPSYESEPTAAQNSWNSPPVPNYEDESTVVRNNQTVPIYDGASTTTRNNSWSSPTVSNHDIRPKQPFRNSWNGPGIGPTQAIPHGHYVTIQLGVREGLQFTPDACRVYMDNKVWIADWSSPQIRVRHILPSGPRRIPYTKPNTNEVTFLPHNSEHQLEITTPEYGAKSIKDRIKYVFTHKEDRDRFQRQVRTRENLQVIQVVRIHTSREKNVAIGAHLKVWSRNDHDTEPTFSFPYLGRDHQHVEYKVRWFRKEPEKRKETLLRLYPYSEDVNLSYGPPGDVPNDKNQAIRNRIRRMSGISSAPSTSRSSFTSSDSAVLYDCQGSQPPADFKLKYLEFEFQSSVLREKFVSACYEAHHRSSSSRPPTIVSEIDSLSPNPASLFSHGSLWTSRGTTPQQSISELECVSPAVEMGVGVGVSPPGPGYTPSLSLPSPAIPHTATMMPLKSPNLLTLPEPAIQTPYELEADEQSPRYGYIGAGLGLLTDPRGMH
ncbi:hypothetical protein F5Y14DRAFT_445580 [Nemania sp. NC0429]|nr:hypothetical protein F5Y14DRAFT_445580 [Nemania sp. NC0429]